MDFESLQVGDPESGLEKVIDIAEMSEGPFPADVSFAAENDLVADRELIVENIFFRKSSLDFIFVNLRTDGLVFVSAVGDCDLTTGRDSTRNSEEQFSR